MHSRRDHELERPAGIFGALQGRHTPNRFLRATKEANHCKYDNEQVIEVTLEKKDTPRQAK
jgi:hypothetical protein